MKMHRALGLAGSAGGEGDQRHVVGGGVNGGKVGRLARQHVLE